MSSFGSNLKPPTRDPLADRQVELVEPRRELGARRRPAGRSAMLTGPRRDQPADDAALRRRIARARPRSAWSSVTVRLDAEAAEVGEVRRAGAARGQRLRAEQVARQPLERAGDDDALPRQRVRAGELELRCARECRCWSGRSSSRRRCVIRKFGFVAAAAAGVGDRPIGGRCRRRAARRPAAAR